MATNCKESTEPLILPSFLLWIPEKRSKEAHKQFALGLGEWTESSSDGEKRMSSLWRECQRSWN